MVASLLGWRQGPKSSPASSIEIKPPVTLGKGRIPTDERSEFVLSGKAGQFLHITVDTDEGYDSPYTISVQMRDGSEVKALPCANEPVFPLPQRGGYRILFDPFNNKHSLSFALLPSNDPLINAGIKPEEVSVNFGSFAGADHFKESPYCSKDYLPANLALSNHQIWVRIMQVAGYKRFFPPVPAIAQLQAALQPGTESVDANQMPRLNLNFAAIVMTARANLFAGEGWRGWRWVEGHSGGGRLAYPVRMSYVFEGITDDSRLFFVLRAPISHPEQQRLQSQIKQQNKSGRKEQSEMRSILEQNLNSAAPSSFRPALDQLDAVVQSFRFSH